MPTYVDGFVIPVPTRKLADYRRLAQRMGKLWIEHGALAVHECAGDDVKPGKLTSFPQAVKLKAGETVVFSWIVYRSRRHRDQVNAQGHERSARRRGDDGADALRHEADVLRRLQADRRAVSASGFIWYELLADDSAAAARFYAAVLGWSARDSGLPGPGYQFFSTGECDVGGLMALPPGAKAMGATPQWLPYVNVPDVDASAAAIAAAGGTRADAAHRHPGHRALRDGRRPAGRAVLRDGADRARRQSTSYRPGVSGHGGWHELHARDWRAAREFYGAQFGWGTVEEMDLGPMGIYLQFGPGGRAAAGADAAASEHASPGPAIGAMMTVPGISHPHWLIYFNVDDIDAAKRRLVAAGGKLDGDVHQVPGDDWILRARDPQGAAFALVGPRWEKHRPV